MYVRRCVYFKMDTIDPSVADPDPSFLGLLDPDPLVRGMDPDPDPSIKQKL